VSESRICFLALPDGAKRRVFFKHPFGTCVRQNKERLVLIP
jgi:hypothetical protein